jgi:hypothetical protein
MKIRHIVTAVAAPAALAAVVLGTAGAASAATTAHPATLTAAHKPAVVHVQPKHKQWNVSGWNEVTLSYQNAPWSYTVYFHQNGSKLGGQLTDANLPAGHQVLRLNGVIYGSTIVFTVHYGPASAQGNRTFYGSIDHKTGAVSGAWSQTGPQGNGPGQTFSLQFPAVKR